MEHQEAVNLREHAGKQQPREQRNNLDADAVPEVAEEKHKEHRENARENPEIPGIVHRQAMHTPDDKQRQREREQIEQHGLVEQHPVQHLQVLLRDIHRLAVGERRRIVVHIIQNI